MFPTFLSKFKPMFETPDSPGGSTVAPGGDVRPGAEGAGESTLPGADTTGEPGDSGNFDGLGQADDDFGGDTVVVAEAALNEPAPAPAAQPEVKPAAAAAPVPQPPQPAPPTAQPAPAQAQPAQPTEPPAQPGAQAQPAASPPELPATLVEQFAQHENDLVQQIAAHKFQLSKEEAEAFDANPAQALPVMAARVYFTAVQTALMHMQNFVPVLAQQVYQRLQDSTRAEDSFYSQFKGIDRAKHSGDVNLFARTMRQMNPQISEKDLFAMVGAAVMAKHGLKEPAAAPAPLGANGAVPPQPMTPPFIPARPGVQVRTTPLPEGAWDGLGKDHEE